MADTFEAYAVPEGFVVDCVFDPDGDYPDFYISVEDLAGVPGFPLPYTESPGCPARVALFGSMEEADLAACWLTVHGWEGV